MEKLLYGAAYYDEYMPKERLEKDMQMMQAAGMNVIRIAESTWASEEPEEGVFDFSHVERAIKAAADHDIYVIVGTPTYAIPPWLAAKYPEIIAVTEDGPGKYGARQNMDITNPHYRFYAERVIRKLMETVQKYDNVVGFQLDNETKHYHTAGKHVQELFVRHLKQEFGTVEEMNREFGFNYWSNRVDCWENVPDVTGTINGSFLAEFEKFRRGLVTEFLLWQRKIVDEYRRPDQFVTHNFDFEWRDYSFGVQPEVDQWKAAQAVTTAGCDIYHRTQDELTGKEASFCGAINRSLKKDNYFILETEAQGHVGWTPYDGQLRLQAFSHLANGADSVLYWHWHSIHNSFETYWRGLLGHDMQENRPYREAMTIGADFARLSPSLLHLKKHNRAAILVSNEALTALSRLPMFPLPGGEVLYNDVVREYHDALYELNVECDVVSVSESGVSELLAGYDLVVAPALYSVPEEVLRALEQYVENGGHLVMSYKGGYANEYLTVYPDTKPHILHKCFGMRYQEYTIPQKVSLKDDLFEVSKEGRDCTVWMELLMPAGAESLAVYEHPYWGAYSAITKHAYGKGTAIYVGCHITPEYTKELMRYAVKEAGIQEPAQQAEFPVVIRSGRNQRGKQIHYYFNFSSDTREQEYLHADAQELLSCRSMTTGECFVLEPWGMAIFEEC
ncbi:MAG: cellulase family glycosylhydrolase [Clostridiales bacterium]|nr:cellulase family glycosylhydrolase [Clostridiales bacterium]